MSRVVQCLLCLWLTGISVSHAALFDDKEARKRIIEVQEQSLANHQEQQKALGDLKQSLEKKLATLEGLINSQGLIELKNQIEFLKQEVAQLKGNNELLAHKLEQTQLRQKELYVDTLNRLQKSEPTSASTTSGENKDIKNPAIAETIDNANQTKENVSQEEVKLLADAEAYDRVSQYKEAFNAYDSFLKTYPTSPKAPEAFYGMGQAQFALKNYKSSIATQQKLIAAYPEHVKAPEAMYSISNSQIQLAQIGEAKATLKKLIKKYPNAEVIPKAKKRLKALEAI